jgi:hypothetical protein
MLSRLGNRSLQRVDASFAKRATGISDLPRSKNYYLARVGYLGWRGFAPFPDGISLGIDVDRQGVAYVTSFRLTREDGASEYAAVLISQTPLKGLVSICSAAE